MLLLLIACKTDDPSKVDGEAVEVGASDPLWDPETLPVYHLNLPDDWATQLKALIPTDACASRESLVGSVDYENPQSGETEHYENVGVRYRGHSALFDGQRYGFKLLFDEVDEEALFHDQKHINLQGTEGDFTLMRERLAREVVDDMDVAAMRVIHARVYINDEFQGIFPQSEEPDSQPFIDENFSKEGGHLYKVSGYCGGVATFTYKDDHPESYIKRYEPKAGTLDEDVMTDLVPMLQCAGEDDAGLQACLPNYIDVDEWLREMAVDAVLPDVDGLPGAGQNFLIYNDPEIQRMVVYPYDKDQSFSVVNLAETSIFSFHPSWDIAPVLTVRMRQIWKAQYCEDVAAALDSYEKMPDKVSELHDFLSPYMEVDPFYQDRDWESQVSDLSSVLPTRTEQVRSELASCP